MLCVVLFVNYLYLLLRRPAEGRLTFRQTVVLLYRVGNRQNSLRRILLDRNILSASNLEGIDFWISNGVNGF